MFHNFRALRVSTRPAGKQSRFSDDRLPAARPVLARKVGETRARLVGPVGLGLGVWGVPTRGALNEGASRSDSSLAGFWFLVVVVGGVKCIAPHT